MDWRRLDDEARKGQRVFLSVDYGDGEPLAIGGAYKPVGHPYGLEWVLDNGNRVRETWIKAWAPMPLACTGIVSLGRGTLTINDGYAHNVVKMDVFKLADAA